MAYFLRFDSPVDGVNEIFDGQTANVGVGNLLAQSAGVSGSAKRGAVSSSDSMAAQAAGVSGAADRGAIGAGTLSAASSAVAGEGQLVGTVSVELTIANGAQNLVDLDGDLVASLNGIIWEWYDDPYSSAGTPVDSGTFNTNASGEATITVVGTSLGPGQTGQIFLFHPTDVETRMTLAVEVT